MRLRKAVQLVRRVTWSMKDHDKIVGGVPSKSPAKTSVKLINVSLQHGRHLHGNKP